MGTKDKKQITKDTFANFMAKLGVNTQNLQQFGTYTLDPFVSRLRVTLEAAYRSSWIVGQVVDTVAEDMTREGITINSNIPPDDLKRVMVTFTKLGLWYSLSLTIKWARLYGGAVAVILTEGADYERPLNVDLVGKNKFKGLAVFDRWMLDPSLGELVTEIGPDMGRPKYYRILPSMPALSGQKVHYSRVIRFDGIELPFYQKVTENLWGLSVVERLYDRLVAFDSATQGISQLLHKVHLRTVGVDGFREALALGGEEETAILKQFNLIRLFQSIEGLTVLDAKDNFQTHQYSFSGVADVLIQFGEQISGATGIPLVRLFGQSPAGLNSTGESDLRNYYDHINKLQESQMRLPMQKLLEVISRSTLGRSLSEEFEFDFNPLWQMSDSEKSQIATSDANVISTVFGAGLISKKIALKELLQHSRVTGRFSNIEEKDIEDADKESQGMEGMPGQLPGAEGSGGLSSSEIQEMVGGGNQDGDLSTIEELKERLKKLGSGSSLDDLKERLEKLTTSEVGDSKRGYFKDGFKQLIKPLVAFALVYKWLNKKPPETSEERVRKLIGGGSFDEGPGESWIGVDLDGTLAKYQKWEGSDKVGEPIPNMVQHVRGLLDKGEKVKIFTARVASDPAAVKVIQKWLVENGLPSLEVTNEKDHDMKYLIDDRVRRVEKNTGKFMDRKQKLVGILDEIQKLKREIKK